MTLTVGKTYRVYLNCGEGRDWSVISLKVVSDEGGGWYKVESGGRSSSLTSTKRSGFTKTDTPAGPRGRGFGRV